MAKRKRARKSKKSFKRAANRTHVSNVSRMRRGGYRR